MMTLVIVLNFFVVQYKLKEILIGCEIVYQFSLSSVLRKKVEKQKMSFAIRRFYSTNKV